MKGQQREWTASEASMQELMFIVHSSYDCEYSVCFGSGGTTTTFTSL